MRLLPWLLSTLLLASSGPSLADTKKPSPPVQLGVRQLPAKDFPWVKYQRHVTGTNYEEVWQLSMRKAGVDGRSAGYLIEAKWTKRNDKEWAQSPYNPLHPHYDEAKILQQAKGLLHIDASQKGKGVRYAVSTGAAQRHFSALFSRHFPEEVRSNHLKVWHVPGDGMR